LLACANNSLKAGLNFSFQKRTTSSYWLWVYVHLVSFQFHLYMMKRPTKTSICPSQLAGKDESVLPDQSRLYLHCCNDNSVPDADGFWTETHPSTLILQTPPVIWFKYLRESYRNFFVLSCPLIFIWWFTSIYHDGQRKDFNWRLSPVTRHYLKNFHPSLYLAIAC
jgi:hypothetical protein